MTGHRRGRPDRQCHPDLSCVSPRGRRGGVTALWLVLAALVWGLLPAGVADAAVDLTPPSVPQAVVGSVGAGTLGLRWDASTDDVGVAGYLVHRDDRFLVWVPAGTSFTDVSVTAGVTYRYVVRAQDGARNNSAPSAAVLLTAAPPPPGVDLTPPSVPSALRGGIAGDAPWLAWSAASDDVGVTGYLVHRDGRFLAWVPGRTDFTDTTAWPGRSYRYEVRAQDAARNNSAPAPALTLTTDAAMPDPPLGGLSGPVVTSWGDDRVADGTPARPYRTVSAAVRAVGDGGVVHISNGVYRERIDLDGRTVSLLAVPGAAPVLSGADRVTVWNESGGRWWAQGPAWPTWGWPGGMVGSARSGLVDLVVVDGVQLRQVLNSAELGAGSFWVDDANRVWIARNPLGRVVEIATRAQGLVARDVAGLVVDGLTFRHYASGPGDAGAVDITGSATVIRDVRVHDNANAGLRLSGPGAVVERTRAERNGRVGATLSHADRAVVRSSVFSDNNTEAFHVFGAAGGIKIAASRQVTVSGNQVNRNLGHGIWFDLSSVDVGIDRNEASANTEGGILVEVAARASVTGNTTNRNRNGIYIVESNDVRITGNTSAYNDTNILVLDGYREGRTCTDRELGAVHTPPVDDRYGCQWPLVTWDIDALVITGNVLIGGDPASPSPRPMLEINHVADPARDVDGEDRRRSAEQMGVVIGANVFERTQAGVPRWVVGWSRWPAYMAVFEDLGAFQAATGQGAGSISNGP